MARKKKAAAKENAERWLLTYADLITLLMVFFVLLFSMSHTDVQKFKALAQSLHSALSTSVFSGSQPVVITGDNGGQSNSLVEEQNFQKITSIVKQFTDSASIPQKQVSTAKTKDGISVTVSGALLFYNGTDQIKPDGIQLLQQLNTYLASLANGIRIEGHTDDISVQNAQYPTNWELSAARAVSVVRYFIDTGRLAPKRLSAVGYGQFQPIVPNDTRDHREQNRRAVIVILYGTQDATGITPTATQHP